MNITLTINGNTHSHDVEPRLLLIHYLREVVGLTGPHIGCETSLCGACTVEVNGRAVKSCSLFAVQAGGASVTTIEGLAVDGKLHAMQGAFWDQDRLQCGFCPRGAAKIKSIDTSKAAAHKGVAAVFIGKDTQHIGPVPCGASLPGLRVPHHHILATDRVYFVGHPVAVVVATDRYVAADAADLIEVDYEVLQAVADPEKAIAPGAPAVHPQWPDNTAFTFHQEHGEIDKAFAEADVVVKQRITSQRLIPTAMETRGVVAEWRAADRALNLYSSTQIPHLLRTLVAQMLGLEENRLRLVAPEVGGGFGSKLNVYAEEALMGFVAMKIGHAVKWIESRRENFTCTIHGRGHVDYYEIAAKKDGTITGIKLKIIQDLGAYHQLLTPAIPTLSVLMMPGLYRTQNVFADIVGVFTNCVPTDAYRGAGRPEATHGIERMVDMLALELKMDPAELRKKNLITKEQFPFPTATGLTYDSGDYSAPLKKALGIVEYDKLRE